jgi:hypothetical protein
MSPFFRREFTINRKLLHGNDISYKLVSMGFLSFDSTVPVVLVYVLGRLSF